MENIACAEECTTNYGSMHGSDAGADAEPSRKEDSDEDTSEATQGAHSFIFVYKSRNIALHTVFLPPAGREATNVELHGIETAALNWVSVHPAK